MHYQTWKSPVGRLHFVASEKELFAIAFDDNWEKVKQALPPFEKGENKVIKQTIAELEEYFGGKRKSFSVPLSVSGTPFQRTAWTALQKIPYGKTFTYGEQAARIKNPNAIRAVGRANGMNKISIIIPCHRVIGADRSITGYAGGIKAKKALLALEGVNDIR